MKSGFLKTRLWYDEGVRPYCNNAMTLDLGNKISSAITHILVMLSTTGLNTTDFHDMYVWLGMPIQFISNTGC